MRFYKAAGIGLIVSALFGGCRSTQFVDLEAEAAVLTPFLEDFESIREMQGRGPFQRVWVEAPLEHLAISARRSEIYIAPVETVYVQKPVEVSGPEVPLEDVAARLRNEFVRAFMESEAPRYIVVEEPGPESVILRLSIVDLNPTRGPSNANIGSMAIEGQLREGQHNHLLFQFTDRELDSLAAKPRRHQRPWAHAEESAHKWANQFEEITRNPKWREEVRD